MMVNSSTSLIERVPLVSQETQRQERTEDQPPSYEKLFPSNQSKPQTHKYKLITQQPASSHEISQEVASKKACSKVFQSKVITQQPTSNTRASTTSSGSCASARDECGLFVGECLNSSGSCVEACLCCLGISAYLK